MRRRRPAPVEPPASIRAFDPADWPDDRGEHDGDIIADQAKYWPAGTDMDVWWWAQTSHQRAERRWRAAQTRWAEQNGVSRAALLYWQLSAPL
jgi:hypothetical protein